MTARTLPLCVDCDGTLIRTDLLHESVFALLKASAFKLLLLPFWLLRGKAVLKEKLAGAVSIDASTLPYNEPLMLWLRQEHSRGRELVLATASHQSLAEGVASHLGIFGRIVATRDGVNAAGAEKARQLSQLYGKGGFDYAGDSSTDVAVWREASGAIVVSDSKSLQADAGRVSQLLQVFDAPRPVLADYLRAMRLHQWLKNLLVFLPALAAHRLGDAATLWAAAGAFFAFGLCASSVYVLNDLLDLPSDRAHERKRQRPFASGRLPVLHGAVMVPLLLLAAAGVAAWLTPAFQLALGLYLAATLAYSVHLKNRVIVDVIVLACLYTLRVVAGAAATAILPSFWLLAFSLFLFLSLALVKRYSELHIVLKKAGQKAAGRGYEVGDLPLLMALGVSAGMVAILVMALYLNSPDVMQLYARPYLLWAIVPMLLQWISRMWIKTHRGLMHDDPVVFAARDWQSILVVALSAGIMAVAGRGGL